MRSFIMTGLLAVSALAFVGCAVNPGQDGTEASAESQDALSTYAQQLVGTFDYHATGSTAKFYNELVLKSDRTYSGSISPVCKPGMACPLYIIQESGTWSASATTHELDLYPSLGGRKAFSVSIKYDNSQIKLQNSSGVELLDRQKTTAGVGEACGGNMTTAKQCDAGLVCFNSSSLPIGDVGGTCMVPVASGGGCGFRTQTAPCATGLDCAHAAGTPLDALTCIPRKSLYGESCGGFIANPKQCADGLACSHIDANGNFINPDLPGVCLEGAGGACGGLIVGVRACAQGFTCKLTSPTIPDKGGLCVAN